MYNAQVENGRDDTHYRVRFHNLTLYAVLQVDTVGKIVFFALRADTSLSH